MAELIVLFGYKALFASVAAVAESRSLDQPVLAIMAARVTELVGIVQRNPDCLTKCISLVLDAVAQDELEWRPVVYTNASATGCFEAESDHLYSVNLLNGTVLVDGIPPGLLPNSVIEDPLYQGTFGSRNFEIVVLGFRHYRTARRVNGHFLYEFSVDSGDCLHIFEHDASVGHFSIDSQYKLLLLRRDLLSDLPRLLQENHSHWFQSTTKLSSCEALPISVSLDNIFDALPECDRLLSRGKTSLLDILARFEHKEYIHITSNSESTVLRYGFPRYKLAFEQTDQEVRSVEFKGFALRRIQLLEDTLPGLTSSIVLFNRNEGHEKVLIPEGKTMSQAKIQIPKEWDTTVDYHIYDVHPRFRHLIAVNTVGRLHLAGLYASTSSYVVDRRLGKPGAIVSTGLVRQCWRNGPLSEIERSKLMEVSAHSKLSCTLRLMCWWIWRSSNSVAFLHGSEEILKIPSLDVDRLALDEYRQDEHAPRLLPSEEYSLLGTRQPKKGTRLLDADCSTETTIYVNQVERKLRNFVIKRRASRSRSQFPLSRPPECVGLEKRVFESLEESYRIFRRLPEKAVESFEAGDVNDLIQQTQKRRQFLETTLLRELSNGDGSAQHRLSRLGGSIATAMPLDILCMTWGESTALLFNPSMSTKSQLRLRITTIDWAMLCVLEDKLHRIRLSQRSGDNHALIIELECVREWNPAEHPRWLAFEVEQQLQVRPHQFSIVQQLRQNRGSTVQLNMGLGKTRVLVPMLVLEQTSTTSTARINALSSIINEAAEYYRSVLVGSVQHVKLFTLPFQRDIPLEEHHARILSEEISKCKAHRGFFIVTPQHRNSLLLKQFDQGVEVPGVNESILDIIDESDAILDHNFQLVYALGTQVPLPDGPPRWTIFEAFLRILAQNDCAEINHIMSDPELVHRESNACGSFPKLRLLLPFKEYEDQVGPALCRRIVAAPPHEFRWMKQIPWESVNLLVSIMSDPNFQGCENSIRSNPLFSRFQSDILAARGCIAHGLLFHGLSLRYRVNYGLNKSSGKLMAVPYSASDTPKPRTEYSQPDMAVLYTCLSYYHDGLSVSQFKDALIYLQSTGPNSQKAVYNEWVRSVRRDVKDEVMTMFDNILKVDVDNKIQFNHMYQSFRCCMEVVCFWMNNFVFRAETYQFPSKRASSAWNLVDSGTAIGFSGTDDNRFLLPLSIKQIAQQEEQLRSTNGEMIDRILSCTRSILLLDHGSSGVPLWQVVLIQAIAQDVHALIDVAGLMAGSSNDQVATFLAGQISEGRFRGVVYFDTNAKRWIVYETENKRSLPLQSSSVTEAESFVYFDESRCRGSDMKLQQDAAALVTLEPKMTKDKFLQGCARMRKLRPGGQSLILAGTSEVVSAESTAKQILETILHNTVRMTRKGLMMYYERGVHYETFPKPIEEDFSLRAMYAGHTPHYEDFCDFLDASHESEALTPGVSNLVDYCADIGQGMTVLAGQLSEECERELENEVEREEEEEIELARQNPFTQQDWPFEQAFLNPEFLFRTLFLPIEEFIGKKLSPLSCIKWSQKVFCTPNFWKTIQQAESSKDLSLYLRLINPMLVLPDGSVVLLSAYELNELLPHWWSLGSGTTHKAVLQHLTCVITGKGFGRDTGIRIPDDVLTSVKLFRGYVQFSGQETKALQQMFNEVPNPSQTIQELLFIRGRLGFFERSDLETFSSNVRL